MEWKVTRTGNQDFQLEHLNRILADIRSTVSRVVPSTTGGSGVAPPTQGEVSWSTITGTPTTISGYGITDLSAAIGFTFDGGGAELVDNSKCDILIPYNCTITKATVLADVSGSVVIDLWKDTYGNYPPTDADSITAAAPPTISSALKSEDSTLTGWTTSITAGQTLRANVDSCTTITRAILILTVTRT